MQRRHNSPPVRESRLGFTLLELLIVLAIILLIAAMVVPNLVGNLQGANEKTTLATIKRMEGTVGSYAADHGGSFFKGSGNEAWQAMINPGTYKGQKLRPLIEEPPLDAWGQVLQYEWTGDGHSKKQGALKPAMWSIGADGQDEGGSGDDINNWTSMAADGTKK
ncbi:MAG: type II secretion system protein GspG [Fuerstia sp.]|nr:type II secretion system protein GspG [Fuerstiella sp.]